MSGSRSRTGFAAGVGMRFAVAALIALHALIHLLGLKLAPTRAEAGLWVATGVVLFGAAVLRVFDRDAWWMIAAVGVVASQVLVIRQWSDAKAGTIPNVLLVLPIVVGAATWSFHREDARRAQELLARAPRAGAVLTPADVATLPAPIGRWLAHSGAVGKPRATSVRLIQRGEMRTSPGATGMPAEATQYFTVESPGFVWCVDVTMMHVLPVVGRDSFVDGHGRMLIEVGGLVTVADGTGPKFDQGTLLRWLAEIVWFPSGALSPVIRWEPVDDRRARATVSQTGIEDVSAVFEIDEQGRVAGLAAKRWFNGETLEDWEIPVAEWRVIRGVEMPTRGGARWKLAKGDFDYYDWEIVDVEANPPGLY